ncbi:unnamed protein product, partial [Discosporangium mesarthrocarpum]
VSSASATAHSSFAQARNSNAWHLGPEHLCQSNREQGLELRYIMVRASVIGAGILGCLPAVVSACSPASSTPNIRYAASSNRLYLEGGGCTTLPEILANRSDKNGTKGPLYYWDMKTNTQTDIMTGTWYLDSELFIEDGSHLEITGPQAGGEVSRLLMRSDEEAFVYIRAYGGNLFVKGTVISSWDVSKGDVDRNVKDGRSYLSAITEIITDASETCDGKALNDKGEARMDIIDSTVAYMGWYYPESYGIAYKVRGLCKDLSNEEIFDHVAVRGDIINSNIHHNYFGHYSFGHQGGNWSFNAVHHNVGYGFDPHDDSDFATIQGNHVFNNGWHGIIASKRCNHVHILDNVVHNNGKNGLMLHRSCDYSIIRGNTVYENGDSGLALYETSNVRVENNYFHDNMRHGMRWSMGSSYNKVLNNTITAGRNNPNPRYAIFMYRGKDMVGIPGTTGRPTANKIFENKLSSDIEVFKIISSDRTMIY